MAPSTIPSVGTLPNSASKRHAACDECRTKKSRCSGDQPTCARCLRESIICNYSPQKRMGRPKKLSRGSETTTQHQSEISSPTTEPAIFSDEGAEASVWSVDLSGYDLSKSGSQFDNIDSYNFGDLISPSPLLWSMGENLAPDTIFDPATHLLTSYTTFSTNSSTAGAAAATTTTAVHSIASVDHSLLAVEGLNCGSDHPVVNLPRPSAIDTSTSANNPICACLSTLYLTLNDLQNMDSSLAFPAAIKPLRKAMRAASQVLACAICPNYFMTAVHNVQIIGTLLASLADRFRYVLDNICAEEHRLETSKSTRLFQFADSEDTDHTAISHDMAPTSFTIELSPTEWRRLAKKAVHYEVHGRLNGTGSQDGNVNNHENSNEMGIGGQSDHKSASTNESSAIYLVGLIKQMMDRQIARHAQEPCKNLSIGPHGNGMGMGGLDIPLEDHLCIKLPMYALKIVEGYNWS